MKKTIENANMLKAITYLDNGTLEELKKINDPMELIQTTFKVGFIQGYKNRTQEIESLLDDCISDIKASNIE